METVRSCLCQFVFFRLNYKLFFDQTYHYIFFNMLYGTQKTEQIQ